MSAVIQALTIACNKVLDQKEVIVKQMIPELSIVKLT